MYMQLIHTNDPQTKPPTHTFHLVHAFGLIASPAKPASCVWFNTAETCL